MAQEGQKMKTPPTMNRPNQSGIQQISCTALSATHATQTIRKSPRCDTENNKTPLLDSHSQTPKPLAKLRGEATTKTQNTTQQNKRNRTMSIALTNKTCPLCKTGCHRQVEKHPQAKSNTKLRSETKNTTITQKPVETLLGLSEPKHLGIEKIEI